MSTALYRRYRPESFADVIGQEHVTEPLQAALRKNRVNHAYLFSGPRGCGKTTSARILARCLNCAEGPTDTPCGRCDSCVELARGGAGSLDVIEIDAASHGGVDDARDLRERATFAPVRDRYKIFIIDEAHMVTSAGFNALLKIVEEPPEHIKFIFATTEPDKVIGTIRSRTHHYPFRLVPPEPLLAYLNSLCQHENVPVAPGVLSLVIRAGGGSVRDSLSVLDQLMAGAGPQGLDYELAVSLLGYTHASLLDDVVEALAAGDSATVFGAVDRVIQTGHDPRRFVEDLLERFRDLIIVNAVPESAQAILRGLPEDQIARMNQQATQLGRAELSRSADVTNSALTEMTGAISPRLHLELLCARLLLPAADQSERGVAARVDRIERRLHFGGEPAAAAVARTAEPPAARAVQAEPAPSERPAPAAPAPEPARPEPVRAEPVRPEPVRAEPATADPARSEPLQSERPAPAAAKAPAPTSVPAAPPAPAAAAAQPPVPGGSESVEMFRRAWPEIMDTLSTIRRATWLNVSKNAKVKSFDGRTLELAFENPGAAANFNRTDHLDNLRAAIQQVIGVDCVINPVHESSTAGGPDPKVAGSRPWSTTDTPATGTSATGRSTTGTPAPTSRPAASPDAVPNPVPEEPRSAPEPQQAAPWQWTDQVPPEPDYPEEEPPLEREAAAPPAGGKPGNLNLQYVEDVPSADDEAIEESRLVGRLAVERILGGRLVEERGANHTP